MKYVNPDSPHSLDIHSEDPSLRRESAGEQTASTQPAVTPATRLDTRTILALVLGAGAISFIITTFISAWTARRLSRAVSLRELKIERLEVGNLQIQGHERATSSMEEAGGVLRFELGSSDVFENGLE